MMARQHDKKKSLLKRVWHFIWDDDSIWSWIVNVILAFVLIKFVLYPGIGFLLGTTHPVVAVVSGSMEHRTADGMICGVRPENYRSDFDTFWQTCGSFYAPFNITSNMFNKFYFKNGFNTGDIIVLVGKKPADINVGDVIVYTANQPDPIIHRVIAKWYRDGKYYFTTKGDHNPGMLPFEEEIVQERVVGKAVFRIPALGYIKIWFVQLLQLLGLGNSVGRLF
jgi:signal peptidase I